MEMDGERNFLQLCELMGQPNYKLQESHIFT